MTNRDRDTYHSADDETNDDRCSGATIYDQASCLRKYNDDKLKVEHVSDTMDGQVCLSVDLLRKEIFEFAGLETMDDEFVSFAAHFIDDEWKMKKRLLCFQPIWGSNFKTPYEAVMQCLKDWGIEGKVSTFTWSNVYRNEDDDEDDEFFADVRTQVESKKTLQLIGQLFHVKCCASMFVHMVEDVFKKIDSIIDKVKMLMWSKSEPLWCLTSHKLKDALELHLMGEFSSGEYEVPSENEWTKVESVCKLADIAYDTAKVLFETEYPTANIYLHNLLELRMILMKESPSSYAFTSNLAKNMLSKLDEYCKSNFLVLAIATVLDPRFKMKYIEYMSTKCEQIGWDQQGTCVGEAIRSLYESYVKTETEKQTSGCNCEEGEMKEKSEAGLCEFKWVDEYEKFIEKNEEIEKSELGKYLKEPVESFSKEFNVLNWWRSEEAKYPILSKMARDILGIPMSVAVSYEACYTEQRTACVNVGSDLANAAMCASSWTGDLHK